MVISVPNWAKQHNGTYEVLADMLDRNVIFNQIPEKALKAFKQVSGKEPNYRKKYATCRTSQQTRWNNIANLKSTVHVVRNT